MGPGSARCPVITAHFSHLRAALGRDDNFGMIGGMRDHCYYVYMLASAPQGTLYVGVTNDLERRIHEHREGAVPGFTKKHAVHRLVWFEEYGDIVEAIGKNV
ncbi:hypothetical protein GCM10008941_18420 [Rhizomicrobium palustre]